jgi:hypothetical protein
MHVYNNQIREISTSTFLMASRVYILGIHTNFRFNKSSRNVMEKSFLPFTQLCSLVELLKMESPAEYSGTHL